MEKTLPNSVLRRKAVTSRQSYQARAMSPAKALRLSLAKAADDLFDLPLVVTGVQHQVLAQSALLETLDDKTLLVLLDHPDGSLGAMSVDRQTLAGLIEMQTTGRVIAAPAQDRPPTRTDAAMIAPLVDGCLQRLEDNLREEEDAYWTGGFRFGAMVENIRMLGLALDAPDFHCFRLGVDLFGGAKQGEVGLFLPLREKPRATGSDPGEAAIGPALGDVVMTMPAQIDAVLCRVFMPLSQVSRLKPGDVLPVPRKSLEVLYLEVGKKHRLAAVRLGQMNGFRAVRMPGPAQDFGEDDMRDIPIATSARTSAKPAASRSEDVFTAKPDDVADDLPSLDDFPSLGDLPDLDIGADLPELDMPAMQLADLPVID